MGPGPSGPARPADFRPRTRPGVSPGSTRRPRPARCAATFSQDQWHSWWPSASRRGHIERRSGAGSSALDEVLWSRATYLMKITYGESIPSRSRLCRRKNQRKIAVARSESGKDRVGSLASLNRSGGQGERSPNQPPDHRGCRAGVMGAYRAGSPSKSRGARSGAFRIRLMITPQSPTARPINLLAQGSPETKPPRQGLRDPDAAVRP